MPSVRGTGKTAVLIAIVLAGILRPALADPPVYAIVDLGTLGGVEAKAHAINNVGTIVGTSYMSDAVTFHGFLWDRGQLTDLGTLGGNESIAYVINDRRQVAGISRTAGGVIHACLWDTSGSLLDLGTLMADGSGSWRGNSRAYGLNALGQVVGCADVIVNSFTFAHACFWNTDATVTDLGTLGGRESIARGINASGDIVGGAEGPDNLLHAFVWNRSGGMKDLGTVGGLFSEALAISDSGTIVGRSTQADAHWQAFVYRNARMSILPPHHGYTASAALSINKYDQIVGYSGNFATLWQDGREWDLNNYVYKAEDWLLVSATSINDNGQITGYGVRNGTLHAFLLTPPAYIVPGDFDRTFLKGGLFK